MCRGNNGQDIFLTPDGYRLYLATLSEAIDQYGWVVHAYCLMSNHYHLLLETPEANLVAGMKWFQGTYTQRFNAMFKRRGHLFQGRYKAIPVSTSEGMEYFRMVSTYIHLNPFRAKLAGEGCRVALEQYPWSSYPAYVGKQRKRPLWLNRERVVKTWGIDPRSPTVAQDYRFKLERFMRFEIDPDAGRRGEFEKQIKRGWYLGDESFLTMLTDMVKKGASSTDNYRGDQRKDHSEAEAERLLSEALDLLELNEEDVLVLKHSALTKQGLAWLIHDHTGVTGRWVSKRMSMGAPVNVSRALKRFRDAKENDVRKLKNRLKSVV